MFPRIKKVVTKAGTYSYLVLSESVRKKGKGSTTRDVARLGNIQGFDQQSIKQVIDGLIRLFKIEDYALADQVEILESLDHGSIIFWRALWNRLRLTQTIDEQIAQSTSRCEIDVAKYIEMMVICRCVNPLSKLATSRWIETTCYAAMKDYSTLSRQVEYFYRSMDSLLKAKDAIEQAIFHRLRDLFSINVRLTFYDITSTYFTDDSCPLGAYGYSRDHRPDKRQIVIGVVTSYEGYPIKHYVFEGNRKDQSTVGEVVRNLKRDYHIEETVFVGDRGMISRLNINQVEAESYDYIFGIKHRQDELTALLFANDHLFSGDKVRLWKGLKIVDHRLAIKAILLWKVAELLELSDTERNSSASWTAFEGLVMSLKADVAMDKPSLARYLRALSTDGKMRGKISRLLKKYHGRCEETVRAVCCFNADRAKSAAEQRRRKLSELSGQLDQVLGGKKKEGLEARMERLFQGHHRKYRKFFHWVRDADGEEPSGHRLDSEAIAKDARYDGVFVLTTSRDDLTAETVVNSYKNLQEVELLFDDLKHFVDVHPVRHRLAIRVRAHVFLCILSLLLKRVLEIDCLKSKSTLIALERVAQSKLVTYRVRLSERSSATRTFRKVTTPTAEQKQLFAQVGVKNPMSLENFLWC